MEKPLEFLVSEITHDDVYFPPVNDRYIVIDTETTGPDPKSANIIEIACVEIKNGKITGNEFHSFIHPRYQIGQVSEKKLKLSSGFYEEYFSDVYSSDKRCLEMFKTFVGNSFIFAHNATLDYLFITNELEHFGISILPRKRFLCTMKIFHDFFPNLRRTHCSLSKCCEFLKLISPNQNYHSAIHDSFMVARIVCKFFQVAALKKELKEKEKLEKEKAEAEKLEKERLERERAEKEKQEKIERERRERLERERRERLERERRERLEKERREKLERERRERREKVERERRERLEKMERERREKERIEKEKAELEAIEKILEEERINEEEAQANMQKAEQQNNKKLVLIKSEQIAEEAPIDIKPEDANFLLEKDEGQESKEIDNLIEVGLELERKKEEEQEKEKEKEKELLNDTSKKEANHNPEPDPDPENFKVFDELEYNEIVQMIEDNHPQEVKTDDPIILSQADLQSLFKDL